MKMIFIHSFVDVFEGMRPEDILHSLKMKMIFIHSFVDVFEGIRPEDILHSLKMFAAVF